jgi:TPR repeat protein
VTLSPSYGEKEKAAKQGYADAQFNLGLCYESGLGVKEDFKQSAYWIKKSKEPRKGAK